jgi:hypothetical protein
MKKEFKGKTVKRFNHLVQLQNIGRPVEPTPWWVKLWGMFRSKPKTTQVIRMVDKTEER